MDEKRSWAEKKPTDKEDPNLAELARPPRVPPEEISEEEKATTAGKEARSRTSSEAEEQPEGRTEQNE